MRAGGPRRSNGTPAKEPAAPTAKYDTVGVRVAIPAQARRQIVAANDAVNRAVALREATVNAVLAALDLDPAGGAGLAWNVTGDADAMTATLVPIEPPEVSPALAAIIEETSRAARN